MCVLTLHRVVDGRERDHDVTWASFLALLDTVARLGVPVGTALVPAPGEGPAAVALSFDDGTDDHGRVAEELAARGLRGIFFAPAGKLGGAGRLSPGRLRELHALGHVVGSHGFRELRLDEARSSADIDREVGDSKRLLEDIVGAAVPYFAPPGGRMRGPIVPLLAEHGYEAARSMTWGIYRPPHGRWAIPSLPVTEFTLARGWIGRALCARTVPFGMRCLWVLKELLPPAVRVPMRTTLHHQHGPAR
jgi:peptidoglycan/xylan/chitin deacetylase (PgdA/CDA1 family)